MKVQIQITHHLTILVVLILVIAPRAVVIAVHLVQVGIRAMTNILVQSIPKDTACLVFYVKDKVDYKNAYESIKVFQDRINLPVIICINHSVEILNTEDLSHFGLQKIKIEGGNPL